MMIVHSLGNKYYYTTIQKNIREGDFMKHFSIALLTLFLSLIVFFILGAFGLADYVDGLVMSIGLIIVILLSVVISILVKIDQNIKKCRNKLKIYYHDQKGGFTMKKN